MIPPALQATNLSHAYASYQVLAPTELTLHAGEVVSKTELTEKLYEQDFERDSNVIEVLIARLRRKLDPDDQWKPIETLRGRGYRMILPRSAEAGPSKY